MEILVRIRQIRTARQSREFLRVEVSGLVHRDRALMHVHLACVSAILITLRFSRSHCRLSPFHPVANGMNWPHCGYRALNKLRRRMRAMSGTSSFSIAGTVIAVLSGPAYAGPTLGVHRFFSRDACIASGKLNRDICENAERNAAAEFEEKVVHYASRAACEQAQGRNRCALSLRQSAGAGGGRNGVSFTPRQDGFRIVVRSDFDIQTTPQAQGLTFSSRTALRRDTSIDVRKAHVAAPHVAPVGGQTFGYSEPTGPVIDRSALPPPIPNDPDFNCADYIDLSKGRDPSTACAPARNRRH